MWRRNGKQITGRLQITVLSLAALSLGGCTSSTIQGQIEDWGLQNYVHTIDRNAYKSALLAYLFSSRHIGYWNFDDDVRQNYEIGNFSIGEEEVAQKAMSSEKQGVATVWTNKRYGEVKFLPGERYQKDGKECRHFSLEYIVTSVGITKESERGKACINPKTGRWEWV